MSYNEKKVYENPDYWEADRYQPIEFERASQTINWLPENIDSILDVGCGNGFITNNISTYKVVGVDRSKNALVHVNKLKCQADVCNLPFSSNSFDVILCSEVIEHIPHFAYNQALLEISRIASKYILLTVPFEEDRQAEMVICPICGCSFHQTYHMRSYHEKELNTLFSNDEKHFEPSKLSKIGTTKSWLFRATIKKLIRILCPWLIEFPPFTLCPQCGFKSSQNNKPNGVVSTKGYGHNRIMQSLKKIWPRNNKPKWWIVLYRNTKM